ncbi:MAG: sulfite exporter TauE/SafE family protein [Flavobacteriaceae bacterium]
MDLWYEIPLLIGVGFLAGIINTLAGGGSLITLPVLIFLGLPPAVANGTNRIAIVIQSFFGSMGYQSKGYPPNRFTLYLGLSASLGALLGAQIAVDIDGAVFNKILAIVMLVVVGLIVASPKKSFEERQQRLKGKHLAWALLGFFCIGIYGGFINAGIGFVIMLFLTQINQLSLIQTNATKVTVVCIYSLCALGTFAWNAKVDWMLGFWMALGTSLGAWLTSRWSVRKGERVVKIALLVMVSVMATKLWFFT